MHNLKEIKIWKRAITLAVSVYKITSDFPAEEKYGLTTQLRRSSVSISSNIAEGTGRNSSNEFAHFLGIANGSAYELQTQLIIANELGLVSTGILEPLLKELDELQKMNYTFQITLRNQRQFS